MNNQAYWVWMQQAINSGGGKLRSILERYGSLKAFYEAGEKDWRIESSIGRSELQKLRNFSIEQAENRIEKVYAVGQKLICYEDEEYPQCLREIYDAPLILYYRGTFPDLSHIPAIAIVGTRKSTENGRRITRSFARDLAKAGVVIVSGGAMGIDQSAHRGAIEGEGKTISVLGCGIDFPYLMGSAPLRREISEHGALISEYPPGTPSLAAHFPVRNRIISGLSMGILVVEAAAHSGSLITARDALEQNRDVYAVPGGLESTFSEGTNQLIKDGAHLVTSAKDILDDLESRCNWVREPSAPLSDKTALAAPEGLSPDGESVYKVLTRMPQHISVLQEKTDLPVAKLMAALTELEIRDAATECENNRYKRAEQEL